ncbi:MAG: hypothetical protein HFH84_18370 [Lachnospiraceae bacterium]|jgi:hypothetical protein|nr:hypothetical protein [Lachnospiraceae bacterium]
MNLLSDIMGMECGQGGRWEAVICWVGCRQWSRFISMCCSGKWLQSSKGKYKWKKVWREGNQAEDGLEIKGIKRSGAESVWH